MKSSCYSHFLNDTQVAYSGDIFLHFHDWYSDTANRTNEWNGVSLIFILLFLQRKYENIPFP